MYSFQLLTVHRNETELVAGYFLPIFLSHFELSFLLISKYFLYIKEIETVHFPVCHLSFELPYFLKKIISSNLSFLF